MMDCGYFDTTLNGSHSSFLTPTVVAGWCPFPLKSALKVTHPLEKCRLRHISDYNVSTVRDSEESSLMMYRKLTTGFPTSYRWSACITPKSRKGGSKSVLWESLSKPLCLPALSWIFSRWHSQHWALVMTAEWRHVWNRVCTTAQWTFQM